MRLSPDLVSEAPQGLNCLGDRELVLRGCAIPVIENLATARDSFDLIDLTSNMITTVGGDGFPPFPRLHSLYVSRNHVERVERGLANSLPNLATLMLTSNRIATLDALNVDELARLPKLEVLSVVDNPVAQLAGLREKLIAKLPALKVLNFSKITVDERKAARGDDIEAHIPPRAKSGGKKGRKRARVGLDANGAAANAPEAKRSRHADDDAFQHKDASLDDDLPPPAKKPRKLTDDEMQAVRKFIENAKSVEQVNNVQEAIQNGTVAEFLQAQKTAPAVVT